MGILSSLISMQCLFSNVKFPFFHATNPNCFILTSISDMAGISDASKKRLVPVLLCYVQMMHRMILLCFMTFTIICRTQSRKRLRSASKYNLPDMAESVENPDSDVPEPSEGDGDDVSTSTSVAPASTPSIAAGSSNKSGKKRARSDDQYLDVMTDSLNKMVENYEKTNEHIAKIVACFQLESECAERRKSLYHEIKAVDGLTDSQRIRASIRIVKNQFEADFFLTLPKDVRYDFLMEVLREQPTPSKALVTEEAK